MENPLKVLNSCQRLYMILYLTILLATKTLATTPAPRDDNVRCSESCLINPYDPSSQIETSLVKHCAKLTNDGKCECDWEKILTDSGECVCQNPRQRINENNQCVCDLSQCPSAPMSDCVILNPGKDCECPTYQCDQDGATVETGEPKDDICPDDSYHSNQTKKDECLCYPCRETDCKDNQTTIIIRKGTQTPGTCCDLYHCDDLHIKKSCEKDGKQYGNGDTWVEGACTMYRCENGIIFQELKEGCENSHLCFSKGIFYSNGDTWSEDECTNCTCVNGSAKCMAHFCKDLPAVTIRPRDECPYLLDCQKQCAFGYRLNRQGCEICKCRQPDAKTVQEIMRAVNCSVESCEVLRAPSIRPAESGPVAEQCPKCPDSLPRIWFCVLIGIIVILTVLTATAFGLYYRERRRAYCNLHPTDAELPHHNYSHLPLYDANSNSEKPIACKKTILELKDSR